MDLLLTKLRIIQEVRLYGYNYGYIIRNLFFEDKVKLIEAEYLDRSKASFYNIKTDLKKENTWSTYQNCVDVVLQVEENDIIVKVTIWDGDNFEGFRTSKRWTASFSGFPTEELIKFQSSIERQFNVKAEELYEEEQEAISTARINLIKSQLLTNSYTNPL